MATYDLCTLDQVKDFIGMTGSNSQVDDLLEDLITMVSDTFSKLCGVTQFKAQDYTEYYNGNGLTELHVDQRPVNSVSLLAEDYDWLWGTDSTYESTAYAIMDDNIVLKDETFPEGRRNIKITYNAGYSTIPTDLNLACMLEVVKLYNSKETIDVISKSYGDGSAVTRFLGGLLPDVKNILRRYAGTGVY